MQLYGLIGYPLTHSFSHKYFTEKFIKEGIVDCIYENFEVENIDDIRSILSKKKHTTDIENGVKNK